VELPDIPAPTDVDDMFKQLKYMEDRMYEKLIRFVPVRQVIPLSFASGCSRQKVSAVKLMYSMSTITSGGVDSPPKSSWRYVLFTFSILGIG
jgi:hypothetical protein